LLDGEEVTVEGRYVRMDRAVNLPRPLQARLPLVIGASGEQRSLRIVARDADVWKRGRRSRGRRPEERHPR
jgi:alkanesulfonate monooxygenase SsuD/methylene tetrahydromethanopterin reductase-like flavin-dependent oxidoreductase (luciferase family)